jgi:hypothetical protein
MVDSRKHPRRSPRKCIFCGDGGVAGNPMSDEHLWPEWMHPYLPRLENPQKDETYQYASATTRTAGVHKQIRQGHVYTRKFHVVCRNCNNGWMGNIETDAKEVLIPLIQGRSVTLLRNDRRRLATWIALKVIVVDGEIPTDSVISQSARTAFKELRKIPSGIRIWIAQHDSITWYSGLRYLPIRGVIELEKGTLTEGKNIQTTAIGFGHLFALALVPGRLEFKFNINFTVVFSNVRQLFPIRDQVIKWPLPTLWDSHVDRLSQVIKEFPGWRVPGR